MHACGHDAHAAIGIGAAHLLHEQRDRLRGKVILAFQPGERWMYGLSADILGAVIEAVSGKKYSKFLQDEIFLPLGMKDTGFYVPADKEWRFAKNYDMVNGELVPLPEVI